MNKVILAYNFTAERLPLLRQVCMMLRVNCKAVPQEEMNDAVGFLAGLKDCAKEAVNPVTKGTGGSGRKGRRRPGGSKKSCCPAFNAGSAKRNGVFMRF